MKTRSLRVAIAGDGIGNLTTTIALQRKDAQIGVFEKLACLESVGAGITLQSNAMRELSHFGLAESILSTASDGRLSCNPDGLWERGHVEGAAESVTEVGKGTDAQLLRCLHHRCEDVHCMDASLAAAV